MFVFTVVGEPQLHCCAYAAYGPPTYSLGLNVVGAVRQIGGNAKTLMLACLSPSFYSETEQTMKFASR